MSAEDRKDAERPRVRQTIVVEGRDDMSAVLAAVDANVLWTHGYGITQQTLDLISAAYENRNSHIYRPGPCRKADKGAPYGAVSKGTARVPYTEPG